MATRCMIAGEMNYRFSWYKVKHSMKCPLPGGVTCKKENLNADSLFLHNNFDIYLGNNPYIV